MSRVLKIGGVVVLAGGAYYLYQANGHGHRAEVLARQDFERMSKATHADQLSAEKLGRQVDEKFREVKTDAFKQYNEGKDKAGQWLEDAKNQAVKLTEARKKELQQGMESAQKTYEQYYSKLTNQADKLTDDARKELEASMKTAQSEYEKQRDILAGKASDWYNEAGKLTEQMRQEIENGFTSVQKSVWAKMRESEKLWQEQRDLLANKASSLSADAKRELQRRMDEARTTYEQNRSELERSAGDNRDQIDAMTRDFARELERDRKRGSGWFGGWF